MPPVSLARLRDELRVLYSPPRRAKATRKQVDQVLREFAELPGVKRTSDVNPVAIAAWMDARPGRSVVRTKSLLATLRAACKYGVARGYMRDPFDFWSPAEWLREDSDAIRPGPAGKPRPVRHRSAEQIAAVLRRADEEAAGGAWEARRLRALAYTYAFTGLRAGEALHLWGSEIDLAGKSLTIAPKPGWRPKTVRSARKLPLADPLAEVLAGWLPDAGSAWLFPTKGRGNPWTTGGPGRRPLDAIKLLGERAGVEGLTILGFRKSIGTLAKSWGISQLERRDLLRHASVETGDFYDEADLDLSRAIVGKIRYFAIAAAAA